MGNIGPGRGSTDRATEDQHILVWLELAGVVSSLLYGTRAIIALNLAAFENKQTKIHSQ